MVRFYGKDPGGNTMLPGSLFFESPDELCLIAFLSICPDLKFSCGQA
jgi:hypothetical protein